ncbi:MAG: hypothetical protein QGG71_23890 [Pirellulaceae bacterium]|jgi:hypothetical protein|nr:hypothetical protein [Pirellulaceae bacterium]
MPNPNIASGKPLIDPAQNKKSRFSITGTNLDMDEKGVTVEHSDVTFEVTKAKPKQQNTELAITIKSAGYTKGQRPNDIQEITVTVTNSNNETDSEDIEVIFDEE